MSELSEFESRVWQAMDRLDHKIDNMAAQMSAVREAQIRMEAVDHTGSLERLDAKLHKLEAKIVVLEAANVAQNAKQSGVSIALEWVYKLGPWVALVLIASNRSLIG